LKTRINSDERETENDLMAAKANVASVTTRNSLTADEMVAVSAAAAATATMAAAVIGTEEAAAATKDKAAAYMAAAAATAAAKADVEIKLIARERKLLAAEAAAAATDDDDVDDISFDDDDDAIDVNNNDNEHVNVKDDTSGSAKTVDSEVYASIKAEMRAAAGEKGSFNGVIEDDDVDDDDDVDIDARVSEAFKRQEAVEKKRRRMSTYQYDDGKCCMWSLSVFVLHRLSIN
jgi:hypothetical protein